MSEEVTPAQVREVLDLELGDNDSGEATIRAYLLRLLKDVWIEGEGFDGKRPFGNSSWDYDIKVPLLKAGLIDGKLDSDGDVEELDDEAADALILAAIGALDAPGQHAEPEPAKVIVVTENGGKERRYDADSWGPFGEHGLDVARNSRPGDPIVGRYAAGAWLAVREEGAIVNDGPADKRKLAIALDTLREMQQNGNGQATEALDRIADVDL